MVGAIRLKVDLCDQVSALQKIKNPLFVEYLCDHTKMIPSLLAESSQQCTWLHYSRGDFLRSQQRDQHWSPALFPAPLSSCVFCFLVKRKAHSMLVVRVGLTLKARQAELSLSLSRRWVKDAELLLPLLKGDSGHSFSSPCVKLLQQTEYTVTVWVKASEDWVLLPCVPIISYKMCQEPESNLRYLLCLHLFIP